MKKVCIFEFPCLKDFHGYSIDSLDPFPYFGGTNSSAVFRKLIEVKSIDEMYRDKYPPYMKFVHDFIDKFQNADVIVFATYNPVHPDVLCNELKRPIKILGFTDDPHSTYIRGIPYLWAFDGAFYISPSYNSRVLFPDALKRWGCNHTYWLPVPVLLPERSAAGGDSFWPLAPPRAEAAKRGDAFFRERDIDLSYVGKVYDSKIRRLAQLRGHFGTRFKIHGRWRLHGYIGFLRWIKGKPPFWNRVRSLSLLEKTQLYYRTRIGFNMHLSDVPMETGNARMYEVPAHGAMLLCDKAGLNAHEQIFEPDKEAVFYDSIKDAIDKIHYYLEHHEERERIARAGFARVHRDYDCETHLNNLLDWAIALPRGKKAGTAERQPLVD